MYNRPYFDTDITYNVTISYNDSYINKTLEVVVDGYKELTNISSVYIGGSSTTYESLGDNLFEIADIITCGFVYPASDGTFTNSSVNGYNYTYYLPKMAEYVIPNAHKSGTWVVLSICGVDTEYDTALETICSDDELLNKFVNNVIELINTYSFDGVDVDWEVPSDGALFTKLMSKLYSAIKANNKNHLVTAAIGGGAWQPPYYDLKNSINYIDYVNMMTYNMSTASGHHHTALYANSSYHNSSNKVANTLSSCTVVESIEIYKNYGVPLNKIIIGSGFYGIVQTRKDLNSEWIYSSNPSYIKIKNTYLPDTSFNYYYDNVAEAPYLISNDGKTFISYENETSVLAKCNYSINNSLAGVMCWQYGLDDGDLLNAMKIGLSK